MNAYIEPNYTQALKNILMTGKSPREITVQDVQQEGIPVNHVSTRLIISHTCYLYSRLRRRQQED